MSKVLKFAKQSARSAKFEALIRPHFAAMYKTACRLTSSVADAEDLVQDVCLKAWSRQAELAGMEFQRAWLLRTLYNHFIDDQRRRKRSPVHLASLVAANDVIDQASPARLQPDRETERIFAAESLRRAMKLLGKEQRMLLVLHDIEGFGLNELQALTGCPQGTLKSKLHRARVRVGRLLEKEHRPEALQAETGMLI